MIIIAIYCMAITDEVYRELKRQQFSQNEVEIID